mmetsp:Transcript_86575/g.166647  ORF Transcript_86575/g.166647 Transcript_86575/m.166647 type:complete len:93 (+) Transcript_86575:746-1024(+)
MQQRLGDSGAAMLKEAAARGRSFKGRPASLNFGGGQMQRKSATVQLPGAATASEQATRHGHSDGSTTGRRGPSDTNSKVHLVSRHVFATAAF